VNNRGDEPRTRLRRLLNRVDEQASVPQSPKVKTGPLSPDPARPGPKRRTGDASPVRPLAPVSQEPPPQITPQPRMAQSSPVVQPRGVEERLEAEDALEKLRQKTAEIAKEYAEGQLNQAQFAAMYSHINEKRIIIEQLLAKDPDTHAWQTVANKVGHTGFLRQHFEARVLAYLLFDNNTLDPDAPITMQATTAPPPEIVKPILTALSMLLKTRTSDKPLRALVKPLEGGQWIGIMPGTYTSAIVLFSLEPSTQQFQRVVDLQRDFETANHASLVRGVRASEQFVFPHRALFEEHNSRPR
jgi:hypothetical protein